MSLLNKRDKDLERLTLSDSRRRYDGDIFDVLTPSGKIASVAVLFTAGLLYYYATDPVARAPECSYRMRRGETISGVLKAEGIEGDDLQRAIDYVCAENSEQFSVGGFGSVMRRDQDGFLDCNYMGAEDVVIKIPDIDRDGDINGKRCPEAVEPR